jgi:hypothetical protein
MTIKDKLASGFKELINRGGKPIRLRYYSIVQDKVYNDAPSLIKSGADFWTSGIVLALDLKRSDMASFEYLQVEQGKLNPQDQRLYVNGSLAVTAANTEVKIGLGSPISDEYSIVPFGGIPGEVEGTKIYKKLYIKRLTNGSLIGEA